MTECLSVEATFELPFGEVLCQQITWRLTMTKLRRSHLIIKLCTNIADNDNVYTQVRGGICKLPVAPAAGLSSAPFPSS